MTLSNGLVSYEIGDKVAETEHYTLYICAQSEMERQCLLQIATDTVHNNIINRAAYMLKELECLARKTEEEYKRTIQKANNLLNYQLGFPELIDNFISDDNGGRQINVLAFRNVDQVGQLIPLVNITARDKLRVDIKSSAWIMGKLLKLSQFFCNNNVSVYFGANNILINPDAHYVIIFDWTLARIHPMGVPIDIRKSQIVQAAEAVITALGGDFRTGTFPSDIGEDEYLYTDFLLRLASGVEGGAKKAHEEFYEIVDSLWERKFHLFTTKKNL